MKSREPVTVAERVAHAASTGNLKMELTKGCDADVITAMGWVGRQNPLGAALLREGVTPGTVRTAVLEAERFAEKVFQRWKLGRGSGFRSRFAREAVKYWQSPVCHECNGVKYQVVQGTPMLSGLACKGCKGTGYRRYPKIGNVKCDSDPWKARFSEVIQHLQAQADWAELMVKKALTSKG